MKYPIEIKGKTNKQVTKLNLSGRGLKEFPENVFEYSNLTKLVLSNNRIKVIPKEILKDDLDHCMRIPMTDKVRALNVSNSAAIAIYEVLRQQNYNDLLREEPHKGADWLER